MKFSKRACFLEKLQIFCLGFYAENCDFAKRQARFEDSMKTFLGNKGLLV